MTGRIFVSAQYAALKNAFRRACQQSGGGLRELAGMTRLSAAQLSRFGDLGSDQWAPLDVVVDLDSLAGEPIITRALAELLGYDLVPAAGEAFPLASPTHHLAGLARESGDVLARLADALADGRLTKAEAARIEQDLADLDAQVQAARQTFRAVVMADGA